ncbi:SDR family NAD(P)-dependent oxidoreductase [Rhizorhabdus argentea]|uniref:SDR family NAD(P)-dependent oxidoreductase n=1 Tax=Rhizorhabdus argentea TaxID=1387174 RepID=UPI0030EE5CDD
MTNPVILIGVNSDVGFEVAQRLLEAGEAVIATARNAEQCTAIMARLPGLQKIFPMDLGSAENVFETLSDIVANSEIAGVILCAAAGGHGPLETVPLATARAALETNALACLAVYQACMPALRRQRGRLVLVSSVSGRITLPFVGVYQASKFALEAIADVMRLEGSMFGVKVVLVEPGGINTKMVQRMLGAVKQELHDLPQPALHLYGDLYKNFISLSEGADWSQMSTAAQVAESIVVAYRHPDPEPRYVVGADAEYLMAQRQARSDREMDAFAMEIYGVRPLVASEDQG